MRVRAVLVRICVAYSFGRRPQVQEEDRARWQTRQARAGAKAASKTAQPAQKAKGYAQATDDTRGRAQAKEAPREERLVLRLGCFALTSPCPAQPRPCLRWPALPRPALPGVALRRRGSPSPSQPKPGPCLMRWPLSQKKRKPSRRCRRQRLCPHSRPLWSSARTAPFGANFGCGLRQSGLWFQRPASDLWLAPCKFCFLALRLSVSGPVALRGA